MATNTLNKLTMIGDGVLSVLGNSLGLHKKVYRHYEKEWGKETNGYKFGETLYVPKPPRFIAKTGGTYSAQNVVESSVAMTADQYWSVDFEFGTKEQTLDQGEYVRTRIEPQLRPLIEKIEKAICTHAQGLNNVVGDYTKLPSSRTDLLTLMTRHQYLSSPKTPRTCVWSPYAYSSILDGIVGAFTPNRNERQIKTGFLEDHFGFDHYSSIYVTENTGGIGTAPSVAEIKGASQSGSSLTTDGWTASQTGIVKKGDIITIEGVYAVNYVDKGTLPHLMEFVVTADADSDGSGNATILISPALDATTTGTQNVSNVPADNADITVKTGTSSQKHMMNFSFTEETIGLACVPLKIPETAVLKKRFTDPESGISILMTGAYDIATRTDKFSMEILFGTALLYQETGVRYMSSST